MKACTVSILASYDMRGEAEMMRRDLEQLLGCDIGLVLPADAEPTRVFLSATDTVFLVVAMGLENRLPGCTRRRAIPPDQMDPPGLAGPARVDSRGHIETLRQRLAQYHDCDIAYFRATDTGPTHVELTRADLNTMFLIVTTPQEARQRLPGNEPRLTCPAAVAISHCRLSVRRPR
jgi:hypothetical protein